MASCDDDFSLLNDDHHRHHRHQQSTTNHHHVPPPHHIHQSYAPHRFTTRPSTDHAPPPPPPPPSSTQAAQPVIPPSGSPKKIGGPMEEDDDDDDGEEDYGDAAFCASSFDSGDPNRLGVGVDVRVEKRKDQSDELGEEGGSFSYKRAKPSSSGGEYRKDREEWGDAAISCLLDAYTEKFTQLNRGNLRGRDWEEVAATVSERCEKQSKSVEQCKNKVDNLKKRYKLEKHRMSNGGISISHWPWFKQMEQIVGNSLTMKVASDEDRSVGSSANTPRISKSLSGRYVLPAPNTAGHMNNAKPKAVSSPRWRRVVFKISGTALAGTCPNNIDSKVAMTIAKEVVVACRMGVEVAIVVGGRNFFCGDSWVTTTGLDRCTAYQIGMMATVMNSILLQSAIEKMGVQTRVQSAFMLQDIAEPYNRQRAVRHLEKGRVVIFGGVGAGTGNPLFSTDSAAALRASEIHAEAVLKGTNVDGVYDCNSQDNNFTFKHISFRELVSRGATSMDMTALTFCEDNNIPVVVFNLLEPGNISKALCGEQVGTLIDQNGRIS